MAPAVPLLALLLLLLPLLLVVVTTAAGAVNVSFFNTDVAVVDDVACGAGADAATATDCGGAIGATVPCVTPVGVVVAPRLCGATAVAAVPLALFNASDDNGWMDG